MRGMFIAVMLGIILLLIAVILQISKMKELSKGYAVTLAMLLAVSFVILLLFLFSDNVAESGLVVGDSTPTTTAVSE